MIGKILVENFAHVSLTVLNFFLEADACGRKIDREKFQEYVQEKVTETVHDFDAVMKFLNQIVIQGHKFPWEIENDKERENQEKQFNFNQGNGLSFFEIPPSAFNKNKADGGISKNEIEDERDEQNGIVRITKNGEIIYDKKDQCYQISDETYTGLVAKIKGPLCEANEKSARLILREYVKNIETKDSTNKKFKSIDMILHCPMCGERHIDKGHFANHPHHTHACQSCGHVWRPSIENTRGVEFLPGFKD